MAQGKKVTKQTLIGEKGIALIHRRCLDMGYLFHPRRVDHGIDGHVDLVDPTTATLLNQTLLVQSKAQDLPFPSESSDSFHYICDERDLNLWLAGNAPVLLVFSHPSTDEAWWVEVKSCFPDATARALRTIHVDKRAQTFDVSRRASTIASVDPTTDRHVPPPSSAQGGAHHEPSPAARSPEQDLPRPRRC